MASYNTEKFRQSYRFFVEMQKAQKGFRREDIARVAGWKINTVKTYVSKKWDKLLEERDGLYFSVGVSTYTEEEYIRMMSQVNRYSNDPYKPELPPNIEGLVLKSREAALLALDIYNRPATMFKSQGFIVMMIIAWTALFHAIFERQHKDYFYHKEDGSFEIIDGDKKAWELSTCITKYYGSTTSPVKENLKLFIGLRNKIEHRYVPAIDPDICGECQALLLNFDEMITNEFSTYYALKETLAVSLQTSTLRTPNQIETIKKFQGKQYKELKEYLDAYRSELPDDIYNDSQFSFRVYLIPKIGNHEASSDIAVEFIKYDPENPDDFESLKRQIALIKEKKVQVANQGKLKPSTISQMVSEKIQRNFNTYNHTQAWKYYNVRKPGNNAQDCKTDYCQYDEAHKDYVYTQRWVDFLVKELSDEDKYNRVISYR